MKKSLILLITSFIIIFMFGCNKVNNQSKIEKVSEEALSTINVVINDKTYVMNLENNETAKEFVNLLPMKINMKDLNNNEKYIYLDNTLKVNTYYPNKIYAGDVMLYGNNCLVIFYKSFETSYSYTKIGHIDDLNINTNDVINVEIFK